MLNKKFIAWYCCHNFFLQWALKLLILQQSNVNFSFASDVVEQMFMLLSRTATLEDRVYLYGKPISELQSVTCHMGSLGSYGSVTSHPTQLNTPCLNLSQMGQNSIYPFRGDGRLSWSRWLVILKMIHRSVHRQSLIQIVATWPLDHKYDTLLLCH